MTELGGREIMSVHLDVMNKLPVELSIGFWFLLFSIEIIVIEFVVWVRARMRACVHMFSISRPTFSPKCKHKSAKWTQKRWQNAGKEMIKLHLNYLMITGWKCHNSVRFEWKPAGFRTGISSFPHEFNNNSSFIIKIASLAEKFNAIFIVYFVGIIESLRSCFQLQQKLFAFFIRCNAIVVHTPLCSVLLC